MAPTALQSSSAVLRVMELSDVSSTAELHRAALPGGFFVALGPRFLRAYHRTFLTSPAGVALVADVDGRPIGFLLGTVDEASHYRHVARYERWRLGWRGVLSLAARPALAAHFIRTRAFRYLRGVLRLSRSSPVEASTVPPPGSGVLSHVAVEPAARGRGAGRLLATAYCETAKAQGACAVRLSAAADNRSAQALYEALHWERGPERTDVDGHEWAQYSLTLL